MESKKRKALDAHMAFIVGEADKLSSMVQEGLTQERSKTPSMKSLDGNGEFISKAELFATNLCYILEDDVDFRASESESDDEVTIEREEAAMKEHEEDVREEVSALNKEADEDIDDLLASVSVFTVLAQLNRFPLFGTAHRFLKLLMQKQARTKNMHLWD